MKKIYGKKLVKIPTPKFYVLYNGKEELKQDILRLSDAFELEADEYSMELTVRVIDVRYESGNKILEKSPSLKGYSYLVSLIHKYIRTDRMKRDKAIHTAIEQCINENVLAEFLRDNFQEVARMFNLEYNQKDEYDAIREDALEEGMEKGMEMGMEKGREEGVEKGVLQGKIELYFSELNYTVRQIADKMKLGEDEVSATLNKLGLV